MGDAQSSAGNPPQPATSLQLGQVQSQLQMISGNLSSANSDIQKIMALVQKPSVDFKKCGTAITSAASLVTAIKGNDAAAGVLATGQLVGHVLTLVGGPQFALFAPIWQFVCSFLPIPGAPTGANLENLMRKVMQDVVDEALAKFGNHLLLQEVKVAQNLLGLDFAYLLKQPMGTAALTSTEVNKVMAMSSTTNQVSNQTLSKLQYSITQAKETKDHAELQRVALWVSHYVNISVEWELSLSWQALLLLQNNQLNICQGILAQVSSQRQVAKSMLEEIFNPTLKGKTWYLYNYLCHPTLGLSSAAWSSVKGYCIGLGIAYVGDISWPQPGKKYVLRCRGSGNYLDTFRGESVDHTDKDNLKWANALAPLNALNDDIWMPYFDPFTGCPEARTNITAGCEWFFQDALGECKIRSWPHNTILVAEFFQGLEKPASHPRRVHSVKPSAGNWSRFRMLFHGFDAGEPIFIFVEVGTGYTLDNYKGKNVGETRGTIDLSKSWPECRWHQWFIVPV